MIRQGTEIVETLSARARETSEITSKVGESIELLKKESETINGFAQDVYKRQQYASGDKPNLNLPGIQEEVLETVAACGKPVVLVLLSGSALAINWPAEHIPAILYGGYPGAQGGSCLLYTSRCV